MTQQVQDTGFEIAGEQAGNRSISTGGLRIDGTPIAIELNYETYEVSAIGDQPTDNYGFTAKLPFIASDKGIILREIKAALAEDREVTAHTDEFGASSFTKLGPVVLGFSEKQVLESVGRFGLNRVLGV